MQIYFYRTSETKSHVYKFVCADLNGFRNNVSAFDSVIEEFGNIRLMRAVSDDKMVSFHDREFLVIWKVTVHDRDPRNKRVDYEPKQYLSLGIRHEVHEGELALAHDWGSNSMMPVLSTHGIVYERKGWLCTALLRSFVKK